MAALSADARNRRAGAHADAALWHEVVRRVHALTHECLRRMNAAQDADDIAQEVLVLLQSPRLVSRLARMSKPEGFLVTTILNRARDRFRRRRAAVAAVARLRSEPAGVAHPLEWADRLAALLETLSDEERDLLRYRFRDGMQIAEIAAVLDLSYSATAVRLFRLLERLRTLLVDEGPRDPM
jgi:RNA polymerase sigma-70 factor (ECF subfamily)